MSVIVMLKDGDKMWAAADSQETWGSKKIILPAQFSKIWPHPEDSNTILGAIGNSTEDAVFRYSGQTLSIDEITTDKIDTKYIINVLYRRWMEALAQHCWLTVPDGHKISEYFNSTFSLAVNGQGWFIYTSGYVLPVETYAAVGTGAEAALSYLKYSTEAGPKKKVIAAVKAAAEKDIYVDTNVIVYCSENKKTKK